MKYYFDIEERLVKRVCVEAPSEEAAADAVSEMYHNEAIVLSADDFEDYAILGVDNPPERTIDLHITVNKPRYD